MPRAALAVLLLLSSLRRTQACVHYCTSSCDPRVKTCFRLPCDPANEQACGGNGACLGDCGDGEFFNEVRDRHGSNIDFREPADERDWSKIGLVLPLSLVCVAMMCCSVWCWYRFPWKKLQSADEDLELGKGKPKPKIVVTKANPAGPTVSLSKKTVQLDVHGVPLPSPTASTCSPSVSRTHSEASTKDAGPMSPEGSEAMSRTGSKNSSKRSGRSREHSEERSHHHRHHHHHHHHHHRSHSEGKSHRSKTREQRLGDSLNDDSRGRAQSGSPRGGHHHSRSRAGSKESSKVSHTRSKESRAGSKDGACHKGSSNRSSPYPSGDPWGSDSEEDSCSDIFVQVPSNGAGSSSSGQSDSKGASLLVSWQALVHRAQEMLERDEWDADANKKRLDAVDDMLTRASHGLDNLQLTPRSKTQRKVIREQIQALEGDFATQLALLKMAEKTSRSSVAELSELSQKKAPRDSQW